MKQPKFFKKNTIPKFEVVKKEAPPKKPWHLPSLPQISIPTLSEMEREKFPLLQQALYNFGVMVWHTITLVMLLTLYLARKILRRFVFSFKYFPFFLERPMWRVQEATEKLYTFLVKKLDRSDKTTISRLVLIDMSLQNMRAKKTRTFITVGGMAIGISAIVFLVSIGYGLQSVVVSRVARLEELRQAEVSPQIGSRVSITDETLAKFHELAHVTNVLPLISVVGRVSYKNSISDMAVYGVTAEYLEQSAIKPYRGRLFTSNELSRQVSRAPIEDIDLPEALPTASYGAMLQPVTFEINPSEWVRVRSSPTTNGAILGYTKAASTQKGAEVWGSSYPSASAQSRDSQVDGKTFSRWIHASVYLWKKQACVVSQGECEEGGYVPLRASDAAQLKQDGYFAELNVKVHDTIAFASPSISEDTAVLGDATQSADLGITSLGDDTVQIASLESHAQNIDTKQVTLSDHAGRVAVVNKSVLQVLGIKENEAIGKDFSVSFIVTSDLLGSNSQNIESHPTQFTIVGVVDEQKNPIFYVPFIDLRSLGVTKFSQVKVVLSQPGYLKNARKQMEAMGFATYSVADTVAQINNIFATLRTFLTLVGMVALGIAALGMFNTLTVSLLERTREVGLMKAMGMKSKEVQELFLTESMIMSIFGGALGITIGFLAGKLLGLILSFIAVFKGIGIIDISQVPFSLVILIAILSACVGLLTGIYPAKRATKISALDALRYE